jgi:hypothetical protein
MVKWCRRNSNVGSVHARRARTEPTAWRTLCTIRGMAGAATRQPPHYSACGRCEAPGAPSSFCRAFLFSSLRVESSHLFLGCYSLGILSLLLPLLNISQTPLPCVIRASLLSWSPLLLCLIHTSSFHPPLVLLPGFDFVLSLNNHVSISLLLLLPFCCGFRGGQAAASESHPGPYVI